MIQFQPIERLPEIAWYTHSTTMAPMMETIRLYMLRPVTPCAPKKVKMTPPMMAPTMPRAISRKGPGHFY